MIRLCPRLAWVYLTIVPILGIGLWLIMSHAHPIFERVFKTYDKLNRTVQEDLRGIRVVKAYVREDREREKERQKGFFAAIGIIGSLIGAAVSWLASHFFGGVAS